MIHVIDARVPGILKPYNVTLVQYSRKATELKKRVGDCEKLTSLRR